MARTAKNMPEFDWGPEVRFKFNNMETKGGDLMFTFQGRSYRFLDGKVYTAPLAVVDHLNSLGVPIYQNEIDAQTGQMRSQRMGLTPRFLCQVLMERHDLDALANKGKGQEVHG